MSLIMGSQGTRGKYSNDFIKKLRDIFGVVSKKLEDDENFKFVTGEVERAIMHSPNLVVNKVGSKLEEFAEYVYEGSFEYLDKICDCKILGITGEEEIEIAKIAFGIIKKYVNMINEIEKEYIADEVRSLLDTFGDYLNASEL